MVFRCALPNKNVGFPLVPLCSDPRDGILPAMSAKEGGLDGSGIHETSLTGPLATDSGSGTDMASPSDVEDKEDPLGGVLLSRYKLVDP